MAAVGLVHALRVAALAGEEQCDRRRHQGHCTPSDRAWFPPFDTARVCVKQVRTARSGRIDRRSNGSRGRRGMMGPVELDDREAAAAPVHGRRPRRRSTPSTPIPRSCARSATALTGRPRRRAGRCAATPTRCGPRLRVRRRRRARERRLIGDAGLHPLGGRGPDIEVGYTLARRAWGRGLRERGRPRARRARVRARSAPRVVAQVEPDNRASRHVLEKLGMTERATRIAYGRPHLLYVVERGVLHGEAGSERGTNRRPRSSTVRGDDTP